jgi:hypothetical protein
LSLSDHYDTTSRILCKTCRWYAGLGDADRAFFDAKADGPPMALLRACRDYGLKIGDSSFREHLANHVSR